MLNPEPVREKVYNLRLSLVEAERLEWLSRHYGLNGAGVIRMLVKRDYDANAPAAPPEPPKRTPKRAK